MTDTVAPRCTRTVAQAIELAEASSARVLADHAPDAAVRRLGLSVHDVGSGQLALMTRSVNLYQNRAVGLGLRGPLTAAQGRRVVEVAREHGASGVAVDLSPLARPGNAGAVLGSAGFSRQSPGGKLWRDGRPLARREHPKGAISIRRVSPPDADVWLDLVGQVWRVFRSRADAYRSRFSAPGWSHYLAWVDGEAAGAGALHVVDLDLPGVGAVRVGHLVDGVTLGAWRRRGIQSEVIRRRVSDGLKAGCRWFTSETAPPLPRMPLVSYRNLCRQGFELAYLRPSYQLRFGD